CCSAWTPPLRDQRSVAGRQLYFQERRRINRALVGRSILWRADLHRQRTESTGENDCRVCACPDAELRRLYLQVRYSSFDPHLCTNLAFIFLPVGDCIEKFIRHRSRSDEISVTARASQTAFRNRPSKSVGETSAPFNVFLTLSRNSLTNATPKVRSDLDKFMSEFIIVGIIVILGVNGIYSRFCEQPKEKR